VRSCGGDRGCRRIPAGDPHDGRTAAMTAAACTQPGCGGTIEDGYCTVCGLAPAPVPTGLAAGTGAAGTGTAGAGTAGAGTAGIGSAGAGIAASGAWSVPTSAGTAGTGWGTVSGSVGTGSRRGTRGTRPGSGRSSRGRLGAGLVEVPPVPALD